MANDERQLQPPTPGPENAFSHPAAAGAAVFASTMAFAPWQLAVLGAWDAASAVAIIWVFVATGTKTSAETAGMATNEDDSRAAADPDRVGGGGEPCGGGVRSPQGRPSSRRRQRNHHCHRRAERRPRLGMRN